MMTDTYLLMMMMMSDRSELKS